MKQYILSFSLIIILFFSCKSDQKKSTEKTVEIASTDFDFVPNPIVVPEQPIRTLKIGEKAPDFKLPGVDGKYHSLNDYTKAKVLVVIFTCNHCPTAQAYEERIKNITKEYSQKSVQLIAISPNSPLGLLYEELGYSDLGDTYEDMIIRAKDKHFNFPYLYDGDNQKVTLAYGPVATPHTFVFDQERKLQYVGRIDASEKPGTANGEDLRNAIDHVLLGKPIAEPATKTFGCSTKWGWKTKTRTKVDNEWKKKEVTLIATDNNTLQQIMKNDGKKLRLINVWATWCAPCRIEYPEFIVMQRMFGERDFEFISLSADKISKKEKALEFLQKKYSAVPNYIATDDDKYAMIEAIAPEWNGALPYTALIEPGGKVIWSHQGEANFQELKKIIVEHPMMGRVY